MPRPSPILKSVRRHFVSGRFEKAKGLLDQAPVSLRNSFEGMALGVGICGGMNDEQGELRLAKKLVSRWPRRAESHLLLAEALCVRTPPKAIPHYRAAWRLFSRREVFLAENLIDSYLTLLVSLGESDVARRVYNDAIQHPLIGPASWLLRLNSSLFGNQGSPQ